MASGTECTLDAALRSHEKPQAKSPKHKVASGSVVKVVHTKRGWTLIEVGKDKHFIKAKKLADHCKQTVAADAASVASADTTPPVDGGETGTLASEVAAAPLPSDLLSRPAPEPESAPEPQPEPEPQSVAPTAAVTTTGGDPNDKIRVAVIGIRGRGESHLRGLGSQKNVEIVAL